MNAHIVHLKGFLGLQRALHWFTLSAPAPSGCPAPLLNHAELPSSRRPERRTFLPALSVDIFLQVRAVAHLAGLYPLSESESTDSAQIAAYLQLSPLELLRCACTSAMLRSALLSSRKRIVVCGGLSQRSRLMDVRA